MAVYIPIGHGYENMKVTRSIIPEGCSLTVIETPGGAHYWNPGDSGEIFEYERIKDYFLRNPPEKNPATGKIDSSIFSNPKENAKEIIDIFGSVAIFGPGEKHPNLEYSLDLNWTLNGLMSASDIRYSGLIPLENFLSNEYSSKNILDKLLTNKGNPASIGGPGAAYMVLPFPNIEQILLHNKKEQYKFSIYPSVNAIEEFWGSRGNWIRLLEDNGFPELAELLKKESSKGSEEEEKAIEVAVKCFEGLLKPPIEVQEDIDEKVVRPLEQEGYINVTLKTLMEKFPGNYIHIVCRGTEETGTGISLNPYAEQEHSKEEIFTKRIPLMSGNQKRKTISNIQRARRNQVSPGFNLRSSKTTANIMLAGVKKSLAQNQIKNTNHPVVLKDPSETQRKNETRKNKVEYSGRKWKTVTTGGKRTRRYKSGLRKYRR
jgi:hypothetical protein